MAKPKKNENTEQDRVADAKVKASALPEPIYVSVSDCWWAVRHRCPISVKTGRIGARVS